MLGGHLGGGQKGDGCAVQAKLRDDIGEGVVEGSVAWVEGVESLPQRAQAIIADRDHPGAGAAGLADHGGRERVAHRAHQRLALGAGPGDRGQPMPARTDQTGGQGGVRGLPGRVAV